MRHPEDNKKSGTPNLSENNPIRSASPVKTNISNWITDLANDKSPIFNDKNDFLDFLFPEDFWDLSEYTQMERKGLYEALISNIEKNDIEKFSLDLGRKLGLQENSNDPTIKMWTTFYSHLMTNFTDQQKDLKFYKNNKKNYEFARSGYNRISPEHYVKIRPRLIVTSHPVEKQPVQFHTPTLQQLFDQQRTRELSETESAIIDSQQNTETSSTVTGSDGGDEQQYSAAPSAEELLETVSTANSAKTVYEADAATSADEPEEVSSAGTTEYPDSLSVTSSSSPSAIEITNSLILETLWGKNNQTEIPFENSACGKALTTWEKKINDVYPFFKTPTEKDIQIKKNGAEIVINLQYHFDENKTADIQLTRTADDKNKTETWACETTDDLLGIKMQYEFIAAESLALRKALKIEDAEMIAIDDIKDHASEKKQVTIFSESIDLTEREKILLRAHFKMGYKKIFYQDTWIQEKNTLTTTPAFFPDKSVTDIDHDENGDSIGTLSAY